MNFPLMGRKKKWISEEADGVQVCGWVQGQAIKVWIEIMVSSTHTHNWPLWRRSVGSVVCTTVSIPRVQLSIHNEETLWGNPEGKYVLWKFLKSNNFANTCAFIPSSWTLHFLIIAALRWGHKSESGAMIPPTWTGLEGWCSPVAVKGLQLNGCHHILLGSRVKWLWAWPPGVCGCSTRAHQIKGRCHG